MSSAAVRPGFSTGAYAEAPEPPKQALDRLATRWGGSLARRLRPPRARAERFARRVEALAPQLAAASEDELTQRIRGLRIDLRRHGFRDRETVPAFALIREVARRELDLFHHPVQLMGGWVMLSGMLAEMDTGEGKTLTATLTAGTAALAGLPTHVITVNPYLVSRDAGEMAPVYRRLGLRVGVVEPQLAPDEKREQYARDVTYCTNKDLTFDYLRDRLALGALRSRTRLHLERLARGRSRAEQLMLRGLCFGIVDEADSVLIDEARTPLIISGGNDADPLEEQVYETAVELARQLEETAHFVADPREKRARITRRGEDRLEELAEGLGGVWTGPHRRSELVTQALSALHLFERDQDYLISPDRKVQIIDEYTGRVMPDRSWQAGLQQMIEAKEGVALSGQTRALAQISYQRFFRRYLRVGGMTGTAQEVGRELWSVYRLPVVRIPTHRPLQRRSLGSRVFERAEHKWQAVVARVQEMRELGRPVLIGTRSVAASEIVSARLERVGLAHRVLNARQDQQEAEIVAEAGQPGRITVATNMAGRGTDIRLSPETEAAGGLHVIATERHESPRIDRQLFGRCGRQGDPGSYESIVSLEDELIVAHGRALPLVGPLERLETAWRGRWDEATAAVSWSRALAVRLAQGRAERLHASIRKAMLKSDEQSETLLAFSGRGE